MSFTAPSTQLQTITIIISTRTFEGRERERKKKGWRGFAAHGLMGTKMTMQRAERCKKEKRERKKSEGAGKFLGKGLFHRRNGECHSNERENGGY